MKSLLSVPLTPAKDWVNNNPPIKLIKSVTITVHARHHNQNHKQLKTQEKPEKRI